MTDLSTLQNVFHWQAEFCRKSGSPFSGLVAEQVQAGLTPDSPYAEALAPWIGAEARQVFEDAAQLRLLAVFHYLSLCGRAPDLAVLYPPHETPEGEKLGAAMLAAARAHPEMVASFMASPPQTNEVARSLCLVGGFLTVAAETGLPLRCLELGASAGLNMNWDRFGYVFGEGAVWGDPASPLQLSCAWEGGLPPRPPGVRVVERAACDQNPIDVTDDDWALRLQSYVWADQTLRLERLRAAIALKRETGGLPDRADAADWVEAHLHPRPGVATVVYHSSFIYYPPEAVRRRITAAVEAAGAMATAEAPIALVSKEPDPQNMSGPDELLLRLWAGRADDGAPRRLALAHAHSAWIKWLG